MEEEIIEHCRNLKLIGYKIPKYVEFVVSLPRHIDGKMFKKEIEDRFWKGIERRG
jgi:long-chain acyl-CoA synthetase